MPKRKNDRTVPLTYTPDPMELPSAFARLDQHFLDSERTMWQDTFRTKTQVSE